MNILSPEAPGEDLFWQARFDEVLDGPYNPMLKGLSALSVGSSVGPHLEPLSTSWRAYLVAVERIKNGGPDIPLLISEIDPTEHPYLACMLPYYRALLDWRAGVSRSDVAAYYQMDTQSDFGQALTVEMQAWHDHLREDFAAHLRGMFEATERFLGCEQPAVWMAGKSLSIAANLSAEMCHHGIAAKCASLCAAFPWSKHQDKDRFNALMGLSLWALLTGKTKDAISLAREAKILNVPRCCTAHALLWTGQIATYSDHHVWASDQIQTAARMYDTSAKVKCLDRRSVPLSLALSYISINADRAREYLVEYHMAEIEANSSTGRDKRLDSIADITLARISRLNDERDAATRLATHSFEVLKRYGYVYRAAMAAMEVGLASKKQSRDQWFRQSLELLSRYSTNSDPYRFVCISQSQPDVHILEREGEVLRGVQEGLTNPEIGERLNISRKTVEIHISSLLRKYGVKNRQELVHRTVLRGARNL